jgi:hypothetical protein
MSVAYSPNGQYIVSASADGIYPCVALTPTCSHPANFSLQITQFMLIFVLSQTQMVGSETRRVAYYIGYPQTAVLGLHSPALLTIISDLFYSTSFS